jgi:2-phospho-L-lactate guanylyltransferase (CobY/MobA/RfbA family)
MHLIIHIDPQGLEKVEIVSATEEQSEAHKLWQLVQEEIESLGTAIRRKMAEATRE